MNTEDRRNVFCIIMSAEDYLDAFERVLHLAIKDQRVVVSVILHCCMSERQFNPYYAILGQHFINHDRKYFLAFQYACWDKIKDLNNCTVAQRKNLASFMLHLIKEGGFPLSVLKVVEFGELDKANHRLVKQILLGVMLEKDEVFSKVFDRISKSSFELAGFKDSIKLFLQHFLYSHKVLDKLSAEEQALMEVRLRKANSLLKQSSDFFNMF